MKYVIMKNDYDDNGEFVQWWFLEKHDDIVGWTDDENYCATKFSYKDALKELQNVRKTAGYACPNFFKSEVFIEPHYA